MWRCCVAQVEFVSSPSGTVYIPPDDSLKTVRCTTNTTADIMWENTFNGNVRLMDPTIFNITQENSTSSIMLVHQRLLANTPVAGLLLIGSISCRSGTTNSGSFMFSQGGKCYTYFNVWVGIIL